MTIDERIEKLTERHEALAPSLELLSIDARETRESVKQLAGTVAEVSRTVDVLARSVLDLVGTVRRHETRIVGLEGSQA